ncbi:hypothetical protein TcWFU_010189 [Taenia crassiceps]|uniref:Uncharacterized protein n=1 Tax=Taenia crassiceps TaxID=6207 RepID=A0ABR4Q476_9CEST
MKCSPLDSLCDAIDSHLLGSAIHAFEDEFNGIPTQVLPVAMLVMVGNHVEFDLGLIPYFPSLAHTGSLSVELWVVQATKQVIFNSKELKIVSAFYQDIPTAVAYDGEQEIATFEFTTDLRVGCVVISVMSFGCYIQSA